MATLQDMISSVSLGDSSMASGYWGSAVAHYQAAGQMGADQVGPAIDSRTGGATAGLTQAAWDTNGLLAELNNSDSATSDDANRAKQFISSMMSRYTAANAYSVAPAAHADVKLPPGNAPMPPIGQALPRMTAPAAPKPILNVAATPRPSAVSPVIAPHLMPVAAKKPAVSLKNMLAAVGLGGVGALVLGPVGIVGGALVGGLGSKYLLKW